MDLNPTSIAFLDKLCRRRGEAWRRLDDIYGPMIRSWLRRQSLAGADADDIAQDVVLVVLRRVGEFQRRRDGSFRTWLRQITLNCIRDHRRRLWRKFSNESQSSITRLAEELEDPRSRLSRQWDAEHDKHVLQFAMNTAQSHFTRQSWLAFHGVVVEGRSLEDIAAKLGMSTNAISIAKSRVCERIRRISRDMI